MIQHSLFGGENVAPFSYDWSHVMLRNALVMVAFDINPAVDGQEQM